MSDLDDILNGNERIELNETSVEPETVEQEPETTGDEVAAPPAAEIVEPPIDVERLRADLAKEKARADAFEARSRDERRKRQEMEQSAERPDIWADPDKHLDIRFQELETRIRNQNYAVLEDMARESWPDFDEKLAEFEVMAQENPALAAQMMSAANPAKFVYKTAKSAMELREAGDVDSLRERIRAEERAKIEAEIKSKSTAKQDAISKIPTSFSDIRGKGSSSDNWAGPTPIKQILG